MIKAPESPRWGSRNRSAWSYLTSGPVPAFAAVVLAVALVLTYVFGHPFGIGTKAIKAPNPTTVTVSTGALAQPSAALPPTSASNSTSGAAVLATPSPVGGYPPAALAPPTTTVQNAGSCKIQPVRGFGLLYTSTPSLATRLGCATGPEAGTSLTIQTYANGRAINVPAQKMTYILASGGN